MTDTTPLNNQTISQTKTLQKRNRKVLSCDRCRMRKIKCDRRQPCSTCIKLKHDCLYTESIESMKISKIKKQQQQQKKEKSIRNNGDSRSTTTDSIPSDEQLDEILEIKRKIADLELKLGKKSSSSPTTKNSIKIPEGEINFQYCFQEWKPLILSHRPFPYLLLMRRDVGAKLLWNYMISSAKAHKNIFDTSVLLNDVKQEKLENLKNQSKIIFGQSHIPEIEENIDINEVKIIIGLNEKSLNFASPGINFNDPISSYFNLIPPAWVNKKLLNIFFKDIYPLMPIIDEIEFRSSLNRILGPEISDDYMNTFPNVDSSNDLAILAMHLIILRLTYLSLLDMNGESDCKLSKYPVTYDAFRAAETILKEFDFTRKQSFPVLQAGIMIRLYLILSSENTTTGSVVQITMGAIVQLCYSIGLNRDPKCYYNLSPKMQNLRRKIWHFIVRLDILNSLIFGTTLSTNPQTYDCSLPTFDNESANCSDLEVEKAIITSFHKYQSLFKLGRKLAKYQLTVETNIKVTDLFKLLDELEQELSSSVGNIKAKTQQYELDSISLLDIKIYIQFKFNLLYVYFTLYLYYEELNDIETQSNYFMKSMKILTEDLSFLNTYIFQKHRPYSVMLFTVSLTEVYLHINNLIFCFIRLRVNCNLHESLENKSNSDQVILSRLNYLLREYGHAQVLLLGDISSRFKYSIMLRRIHLLCSKLTENLPDILSFNNQENIKLAGLKIPIEILKNFGNLMFQNLPHKDRDLFNLSDGELIMEMRRENMWNQLKKIQTEEMVTSSWIDKTKRFNKLTEDLEIPGLNLNFLTFDTTSYNY
ncbi:uncharacterized protein KGF55_001369 [Candida pseudojiufengensis]|uniref:uncharacterized protein n=1 Tax=Candida pseudojiufengensis TaxID=497109 RepID=UPI0022242868|nr:uncharacterized protein KGF55_001369 [Candida pseudojiufengensis]KAI5965149.1 hypothetical protein KGF55_001369 [Candida pseudojiufengensis]